VLKFFFFYALKLYFSLVHWSSFSFSLELRLSFFFPNIEALSLSVTTYSGGVHTLSLLPNIYIYISPPSHLSFSSLLQHLPNLRVLFPFNKSPFYHSSHRSHFLPSVEGFCLLSIAEHLEGACTLPSIGSPPLFGHSFFFLLFVATHPKGAHTLLQHI